MKYVLAHDTARKRALEAVANAPAGYVISIKEPNRTSEQNAKFHAICSELAGTEWAGKKRDATAWKVLLVSGHAMATNERVELIPGLESEFVNVRESTALMSKARGASLIDYSEAWLAKLKEEATA